MHTEMWEHPAVQDNLRVLAGRGVTIVPPDEGRLAGGDVGAGRLADPEHIVAALEAALGPDDLAGLDVLVTAGGTREPIDPVRFVGNRSSGKQGHALADEAASRGAKVTLVTTVEPPGRPRRRGGAGGHRGRDGRRRTRAQRPRRRGRHGRGRGRLPTGHCGGRQAQEGGRPSRRSPSCRPTTSSAACSSARWPGQTLVGFAAETDDVDANAAAKLARKPVDLLVVNDVSQPGAGFESDTNEVRIMSPAGSTVTVDQRDKRAVARAVLDAVVAHRATP